MPKGKAPVVCTKNIICDEGSAGKIGPPPLSNAGVFQTYNTGKGQGCERFPLPTLSCNVKRNVEDVLLLCMYVTCVYWSRAMEVYLGNSKAKAPSPVKFI